MFLVQFEQQAVFLEHTPGTRCIGAGGKGIPDHLLRAQGSIAGLNTLILHPAAPAAVFKGLHLASSPLVIILIIPHFDGECVMRKDG
jgi:hypothetical protein